MNNPTRLKQRADAALDSTVGSIRTFAPWMRRARAWMGVGLAVVNGGCGLFHTTPKRQVIWPNDDSATLVGAPMEAGAAIAAAAAVREMIDKNDIKGLFDGCASPEQGLDVAVFKQKESDLYFVVLHQRFNRCGGPVGRVLDWWYEYAVTARGEVVAEAPPMAWDEPPIPSAPMESVSPSSPDKETLPSSPTPSEQVPSPDADPSALTPAATSPSLPTQETTGTGASPSRTPAPDILTPTPDSPETEHRPR